MNGKFLKYEHSNIDEVIIALLHYSPTLIEIPWSFICLVELYLSATNQPSLRKEMWEKMIRKYSRLQLGVRRDRTPRVVDPVPVESGCSSRVGSGSRFLLYVRIRTFFWRWDPDPSQLHSFFKDLSRQYINYINFFCILYRKKKVKGKSWSKLGRIRILVVLESWLQAGIRIYFYPKVGSGSGSTSSGS